MLLPNFFTDFYLPADDANLLYSNEKVVNEELSKVCDWLGENKLALKTSKSNFVIFYPTNKFKIRKPDCIIQYKNLLLI